MKVLFLTPQLPYPALSGGTIKTRLLIDYLAAHHQLSIACFLKGEDSQQLEAFSRSVAPVPCHTQPLDIPRTPLNFVRSCLKGIALTLYRNLHAGFAAKVAELAQQQDVLFVDHYLMFQYVPQGFQGRVVVHQHNAEYLMWSRKAELERNWLLKRLLAFEAERIKRFELALCAQADAVLTTNSDAKALLSAGASGDNFFETMHCAEADLFNAPDLDYDATEPSLLFIGTLSWDANLDGLLWFGERIWPRLRAKLPQLKLTVVGKCSASVQLQLQQALPGADIAGFVEDLEPLYRRHRVFIAPLRFGSGVKVKVVNSLTRGQPTVATSVGAEGIGVEHGKQIMICDDPLAFTEAVVALLGQPSLWRQLAQTSRQWMKANYSLEKEQQNIDRSLGL